MDVIMPQLGETVREGVVSVWYKKPGEEVRADEPLFVVESDKVTSEIPAPVSGFVDEILVPAGQTVKVGTRLATIRTAAPGAENGPGAREPKLSPVVRRLLAEHRIDPAAIAGTGAEGRITRDDVLAVLERKPAGEPRTDRTVIPMSRIRKLTAARTSLSVATSPHVLQAMEVDFFKVDELRRTAGESWKAREKFALTYLPFIARAVCEAIARFPHVNASISGESLIVHAQVQLGFAVDLEFEGLMVPVVRDAGTKNLRALALEMHELADKARRGVLKNDDIAGGTYTLSNSGSFGTLLTAPIIHQPQVAILSTDGVRKKAAVVEGAQGDTIAIRPIGVLAQCFDHRAFDGAYSAAFLRCVKGILEQRDFSGELA
jgi:2-oxoglutarate dehydrogenase E2 component (dihydrolipoamide succinyltransferase)